jgi:hypothetical protein
MFRKLTADDPLDTRANLLGNNARDDRARRLSTTREAKDKVKITPFAILRLMASSVYIETTIISYLTAKPSRDLIVAAHQQITSEWWASVRPEVECFVSPFVIDEATRGDDEYASLVGLKRLQTSQSCR